MITVGRSLGPQSALGNVNSLNYVILNFLKKLGSISEYDKLKTKQGLQSARRRA